MTRCDHCGTEVTLPFTCQHCGGKFCADHRLPPNHNCTGLMSWNKKPKPAIGANYGRSGVSATGGIAMESRRSAAGPAAGRIPWLWVMAAIIGLVLLAVVWLVATEYRFS